MNFFIPVFFTFLRRKCCKDFSLKNDFVRTTYCLIILKMVTWLLKMTTTLSQTEHFNEGWFLYSSVWYLASCVFKATADRNNATCMCTSKGNTYYYLVKNALIGGFWTKQLFWYTKTNRVYIANSSSRHDLRTLIPAICFISIYCLIHLKDWPWLQILHYIEKQITFV